MEQEETKFKEKEKKRSKGILTALSAGVLGSALTLTIAPQLDVFESESGVVDRQTEVATNEEKANSAVSVQPLSTSNTTNSVADIVEQTSEAIVGVVNITEQSSPFSRSIEEMENGTGSGVIYKVTDDAAYIVTNHHVIEGASEIQVSLYDGKVENAKLVGTDALTDIAVLKMEGSYDVTPIPFGDSDGLRAGEQVIAIGNPLGLDLSRTVTQGIVSATNRTITSSTTAGEWEVEVIQTDAAINPGNSGGALINTSGQLVGINSMKIANAGVEGLGFAIPINDVKGLVEELEKNGQVLRPYLGVGLASLTEIHPFYLQNYEGEYGAMVVSIDENSQAYESGLRVEDIIVSIDGNKIEESDDLRKYLYTETAIGDTVTIQYYRDNQLKTTKVTLASNEN
ncbi:S1C family serine protease [Salirhabdus sp. Marseille-P4669]|uniref:S1C family serine protease n=1 Tax=Salirhabdus sp. Marseille-P4669 TaxID=2042310 RepID=UPI000C7C9CAD|nr:trypsin-like peptidase domain-containing protein [Salirhabdus sp. Marseille-P4669]